MASRTLAVPLPRHVPCTDCARVLHERLALVPGVGVVTFDHDHHKVWLEIEDNDLIHGRLIGELAAAFSDSEDGSLASEHLEHADRPAAHGLHRVATDNRWRLLLVAVVGLGVITMEVIGGLAANSLVLLADAAHYATDLVSVLLAYVALTIGMREASRTKTFGYQRAEVVAALVQAIGLWAISLYFLWEGYRRLLAPPPVEGAIVVLVGAVSLVINAGLAWLLHRPGEGNINIRAAYLHILSDVLGSAAAVVAGGLVWWRGWHIADAILTLVVTGLILVFTVRLTRQTLHILLEGVPSHIDPKDLENTLRQVQGVQDVHDLHVWTLTSGVDSLSAHVVLAQAPQDDHVSHEIHDRVRNRFDIEHITVQVESPQCPCDTMQHQWRTPN